MFADVLLWQQYPLYYPRSISGYERVKMITMTQMTMMETEPLTKQLVIFGATGDLCKKKLIPALYELCRGSYCQRTFLLLALLGENPLYSSGKNLLESIQKNFSIVLIIKHLT